MLRMCRPRPARSGVGHWFLFSYATVLRAKERGGVCAMWVMDVSCLLTAHNSVLPILFPKRTTRFPRLSCGLRLAYPPPPLHTYP